jgi:hypothetical protein
MAHKWWHKPGKKATKKRIEKLRKKGVTTRGPVQGKGYELTEEVVKASGRIRKGSKEQVVTKGGVYQKYGKKSKAAGSFRSAFKKGCEGGAKAFNWDGRSYSCAKKSDKKKKPAKEMTVKQKPVIEQKDQPPSQRSGR